MVERPVETEAQAESTLAREQPTNAAARADARGQDATTEIIRAAEEAADRVAGVLQGAEEAAEQRLAEAQSEAAAIQRQAEIDAELQTEQAERVRAEADEYMANVRLAADAAASQRQADALEQSRKLLEQAELEARSLRKADAESKSADDAIRLVDVDGVELPADSGRVRHGIEMTAVLALMSRDISVFVRSWRSTTFSAIVEPIILLLAFGLGFGALISKVRGVDYIQFVATGVVATTVVFSSAFPGMFSTFVKREFQRIYDALLATPVNVDELVTAEVLWISIRTGVYSTAPVLVAIGFGLRPGWGIVLVPLMALRRGLRPGLFRSHDGSDDEVDRQFQLHHQRRSDSADSFGRCVFPCRQTSPLGFHCRPIQSALSLRHARPKCRVRLRHRPRPLPPRGAPLLWRGHVADRDLAPKAAVDRRGSRGSRGD